MKTGRKTTRLQGRAVPPPSILDWSGIFCSKSIALYCLLLAVLGTGLSVVHTTHANRFAFNELQELREHANQIEVKWGQLLLEQSTFGVEGRIEQKAVEQLKMQLPELSSIVMVTNE